MVASVEEDQVTVGNNQAPQAWIKKYFREGDAEKIQQAVKAAESKTSGDIVPMVVHRSANLSHVSPTVFLLLYVTILLAGTHFLVEERDVNFLIFALSAGVFSLLVAIAAGYIELIQRLVLPRRLLNHEVHTRAELEFYRNHFDQTKSHGAVLIFISLFERRVVVLCDQFLAKKVPQQRWDTVAEIISSSMKQNNLLEGLLKALVLSGAILAEVLPGDGSQPHEISTDFRIQE